jgi:acetylornithine deacetylase
MNIGAINGGTKPNIVPAYAESRIEFRTTIPNSQIKKLLSEAVGDYEVENDYDPAEGEIWFKSDKKPLTAPYFTELYWWAQKSKAIVFGPGNIKYAHKDNERIAKKDLVKAVEDYGNIIRQTLG